MTNAAVHAASVISDFSNVFLECIFNSVLDTHSNQDGLLWIKRQQLRSQCYL